MNKKVEIVIKDGQFYDKSHKDGAEYTSISYSGHNYGGGSPCDTPEEVKSAIEHAKQVILKEEDKPIIMDRREGNKLTKWL